MIWPGGTNTWPTTNWRQCNGATLSKTTYPELFAVIGYTYGGSGDNFELPNLRGKFVTGVGLTVGTIF